VRLVVVGWTDGLLSPLILFFSSYKNESTLPLPVFRQRKYIISLRYQLHHSFAPTKYHKRHLGWVETEKGSDKIKGKKIRTKAQPQ
jgi:hypothetical protein